jgi:isocitrate/isopropylmalate dehydrogenase
VQAHKIALIRGDGIGPELVDAALAVLAAVTASGGFTLEYVEVDAGADTYRRTGKSCADADVELMRSEVDATLKGPVGLPDVRLPDGTEAGLLGGVLRTGLDLYANVRPVLLLPGVPSPLAGSAPGDIDYVIVRENTEGLYASRGKGVGNRWAVSDALITTREGSLRVCRRAFEIARGRGRARRVTCVDKSNVLRSHALFREIFTEVAAEFPDIGTEFLYADAAAQALVLRPGEFDVLVMENFLGDVLSDLGGATVGGISYCAGGNLGDHAAYFEPIHGSAPAIAGRDLANPVGQILAAAMMLAHLGHPGTSDAIQRAVAAALSSGTVRVRPDGTAEGGPRAVADAVISFVDKEVS